MTALVVLSLAFPMGGHETLRFRVLRILSVVEVQIKLQMEKRITLDVPPTSRLPDMSSFYYRHSNIYTSVKWRFMVKVSSFNSFSVIVTTPVLVSHARQRETTIGTLVYLIVVHTVYFRLNSWTSQFLTSVI